MEIVKADNSFYVGESPEAMEAEITFTLVDTDLIQIDHTYVSETLSGKGVGLQLVNKVVELARQENRKIMPVCPFAKKVMTKSDEYLDVLAEP